MFKKGTKLYSVIKGKCPRCQEGEFFKYTISYNPSKISEIHKHCSHCNLKYMIEPSFFYGAMYVNYGITVGISIIIFLITKFIFKFTLLNSFYTIIVILILSAPLSLRLSRILWINFFVDYQETFREGNKEI